MSNAILTQFYGSRFGIDMQMLLTAEIVKSERNWEVLSSTKLCPVITTSIANSTA